MKKRFLYIFLFFFLSQGGFSVPTQDQAPPEPGMKSHDNGVRGPCGQPDQGQGVPPPVGLCLPINDYLFPLLVTGILLGAYKARKMPGS